MSAEEQHIMEETKKAGSRTCAGTTLPTMDLT
jgi:hypothetical protein